MNLSMVNQVITSLLLILISIFGLMKKKHNIMYFLLFMEIILVSVTLLLAATLQLNNSLGGQILGFYILTVAAVESALCICLVVQFFRLNGTIEITRINASRK